MAAPDPARPPANETEERLLDRALTLFAEKGYEAASVREIIEAAGVTRPVLYYYAAGKEDLFKRLVRWKHDAAYRELGEAVRAAGSAADRLRAVARGTFAFCGRDPRVPRLMFQTHYGPPVAGIAAFMAAVAALRFGLVSEVMRAGLDAGELAGGGAASLALAFCCVVDQHVNVLARLPDPQARLTPELADGLVDLFLSGAGTGERRPARLPPFAGA